MFCGWAVLHALNDTRIMHSKDVQCNSLESPRRMPEMERAHSKMAKFESPGNNPNLRFF